MDAPFQLRYHLTRRHRLAALLEGWQPCLAACIGFTLGVTFLGAVVSPRFFVLLAFPAVVSRRFFRELVGIVRIPNRPVELAVENGELAVTNDRDRRVLPLTGIVQVFRTGDGWTVLHLTGPALTIPAAAITDAQVDYLKSFARAAREARASLVGARPG